MKQEQLDSIVETIASEDFLRGVFTDAYNNTLQKVGPAKAAKSIPGTDLDAGRWIHNVIKDNVRYINTSATKGTWYVWDSTIWRVEPSGKLTARIVDAFIDATGSFIHRLSNEVEKEALDFAGKYNLDIKSERKVVGLRKRVILALGENGMYFDNDRDFIVFADGQVLDTNNPSGELLAPDPSRPVSRKMGVTLGEGTPERLMKAFEDWRIPKDQQRYLQVAAGAAALGRGDAKNIATLVGVSNTGKSSFIRTILKGFGSYGGILPAGAIVAKTSTNFEQHKARGTRFLYLEEPYEARTDDSFLKNLSGGGGVVPTQQKGLDVVEWIPQCLLFIGSNHIPKINTQDDAIVKRMNIVGFNRVFKAGDGVFNKNIEDELIEKEGPQIARWIIEGALEYDRLGYIPVPESIHENAATNTTNSSVSLRWLQEQFENQTLINVKGQDVAHRNMAPDTKERYQEFSMWCLENGEKRIPSKDAWAKEINRFQGQPVTHEGKRPGGSKRLWGVIVPGDIEKALGIPQEKFFQTVSDGVATVR